MEFGNTAISDGVSEPHHSPDSADDTSEESVSVTFDSHLVGTAKSQQNMFLCQQPKRKRTMSDLENQVVGAPEEQQEEDDHEHFLKSLLPTMRTLGPLAAMEYRHEVQGLLIKYIRKAQSTKFAKSGRW